MIVPDAAGARWRWLLADAAEPEVQRWLAAGPESVAAPGRGETIKRTRTGWVQRLQVGSAGFFVKTYVYPTLRDRLRGVLRNTWLRPSRAAREADALRWLRARGFAAPRPVAVGEARRRGLLHAAVLVTEAVEGTPLDAALPAMPADQRAAVLTRLRAFVSRLHEAGFRDRNLDLRNLLLCPGTDGPRFVKIDSPRFVLQRPGPARDRLARADWQRLGASLA
ncbi:MAG TPA: lipopolysaccharide kinase InaA family protein, partial [Planctomycetota bacterium]|nr:lipopolysaccharide kinase InaA family protein [Planctomycetota bacterium]